MSKEKVFLKNTTIIVAGKICTQCVSFFLLPLYTAILSKREYGIVDLINTYITLLLPIISLQMEQGFFRFLIESRDDITKQNNIFSTAFWGLSASNLLFLTVLVIGIILFDIPYGLFLITNILISAYSSNLLGAARGLGFYSIYSIGSFLIGISTILFNILFIVYFKMGARGMLLAYFCANFVGTIYCFIKLHSFAMLQKGKFTFKLYKEILKYTLPLVPNTISWWIINASDRTIISAILGVASNGIFSVANKFSGVYITIYSLFNMTLTENVILYSKDEDSKVFLVDIINGYIRFFSCICLGIIACMPFVFPYMVNNQFADSYNQIPLLMLASMFNVLVGLCTTLYVANKKSTKIAKFSLISAITNIVINLCMIKFIGLYAASLSTCISYVLTTLMMYFDLKKTDEIIKVDFRYLSSFIVVMVVTLIVYYCGGIIFKAVILLCICCYSIFSVRNYIKPLVNIVLNKIGRRG